MLLILFLYAFLSNVALAVVPHEPVVVWYGATRGVWLTALVATAGTVTAAWVDHRIFVPLITRAGALQPKRSGAVARLVELFSRAPFAILTVGGVTPLPFFPFKALAFASRYPLYRYLAAVALGRFPRYVLLAWFGVVLRIPTWLLAIAFLALAIPPFRMLRWRHRNES